MVNGARYRELSCIFLFSKGGLQVCQQTPQLLIPEQTDSPACVLECRYRHLKMLPSNHKRALELKRYLFCSSTIHQLSQRREENLITAGGVDGMLWLAGTPEGGMELGGRYHGQTIDPSVSSQDGLIRGVSLVSTYKWH